MSRLIVPLTSPDSGHPDLADRTDFAAHSWQSASNSSCKRTTNFAGAPASNTARVAPAIAEYNINPHWRILGPRSVESQTHRARGKQLRRDEKVRRPK